MKRKNIIAIILITLSCIVACSPEVGSTKWCDNLEDKPKGDWTANEATDYAKHCLIQSREDN